MGRRKVPLAEGGVGTALGLGVGAQLAFGGGADRTVQIRAELHRPGARNAILLLGDGIGVQEATGPVPARLRPRLGLHRHDVGDRREDDR